MKKMILLTVTILSISTLLHSCNTTGPPPPVKHENPREYVWTIDTLNIPDAFQNTMRSIWGSSANDIYIVGHHSGSQIYPGNGNMWHYDGKTWKVVDIYNVLRWNGNLSAVNGSSPTNVWAVGWNEITSRGITFNIPYVIHYNGSRWERHKVDTKHATYGVYVEDENNVWACGDGGLVYHYDGNDWTVDTVKIELKENEVFRIHRVVGYNSDIYITGVKHVSNEGWGTLYFMQKGQNNWAVMDSTVWGFDNPKFDIALHVSRSNELYSIGMGGIFKWENKEWQNVFTLVTSINSMSVEAENNIIAVGSFSKAYHFNGTDWKQFQKLGFNDVMYTGVLLYKNEAFIIGTTSVGTQDKTIVLHGK